MDHDAVRLARRRAPDEPEPQRLLMLTGPWLLSEVPTREQQPAFHHALGEAYRLLGEEKQSASHFLRAGLPDPDASSES